MYPETPLTGDQTSIASKRRPASTVTVGTADGVVVAVPVGVKTTEGLGVGLGSGGVLVGGGTGVIVRVGVEAPGTATESSFEKPLSAAAPS